MSAFIKGVLLIVALMVTFFAMAPFARGEEQVFESPVPADQWSSDVRLWLARSVLGEVGWLRLDEQAAVAWVYARRAQMSRNHTFLEMVKTYSAAIKTVGKRRNPWLFELDETVARPKSWPLSEQGLGPRWKGLHDKAWLKTLDMVDRWQAGKVANPCPGANHFGGYVDEHRARRQRWVRVKCSVRTRNRFYDSHRLTSIPSRVSIPGYCP